MDNTTIKNSFGKWLKPLCSKPFYELVETLALDRYIKKFIAFDYIKLMLHAQLQERDCLRAIVADLAVPEFQRVLNMDAISISQLSRKHNQFDTDLLCTMFQHLVGLIQNKQLKKKAFLQKDLRIIDSTTISMCLSKYPWASFRETKAGIKVHTRIRFVNDPKDVYPDRITITPAEQHDRTQLESLVDHNCGDTTYVFDRGYLDLGVFDDYCEKGTFFVSRIKSNTVRESMMTNQPTHADILSDEMVYLGKGPKKTANAFRLIKTTDSKGNVIEIVSNHFLKESEEIAEMYRSRWAIESFFKWLKQHVEIKKMYGTSEKAVHNQVLIALIAHALTLLLKLETYPKSNVSLLEITRKLKALLWKSITKLNHAIRGVPT